MRGGERKTHACTRLSQQERVDRIAALNDRLRRTGHGGRIMLTAGIAALGNATVRAVLLMVAAFDAFDADNDPYGERDFGKLTIGAERILWKIDYYDRACIGGSPNPADPAVTTRMLTVMLAAEY